MSGAETLLANEEIPSTITIDGRRHQVIERMQNFHYRALLLPHGGGGPVWFSNEKLRAAIKRDAQASRIKLVDGINLAYFKAEARKELSRMPALREEPRRWEQNSRYIRLMLAQATRAVINHRQGKRT